MLLTTLSAHERAGLCNLRMVGVGAPRFWKYSVLATTVVEVATLHCKTYMVIYPVYFSHRNIDHW